MVYVKGLGLSLVMSHSPFLTYGGVGRRVSDAAVWPFLGKLLFSRTSAQFWFLKWGF
jgi:hypothetical protein